MRRPVEERLVAPRERRPHALALRRRVPVRGGRDGAVVGREADQDRVVAAYRSRDQLTEVELAPRAHLRRAGVADVGVVGPDDHLGRLAVARRGAPAGCVERVRHVAVAQVPGARVRRRTSPGSTPRRRHQPGVLLGVELLVLRGAARRGAGSRPTLRCSSSELLDDPAPARLADPRGAPLARTPGSRRRTARSTRSARGHAPRAGGSTVSR